MESFGVRVDYSKSPPAVEFADRFNVTVPLLDRHVAEGNGGRVVARWPGGRLTFGGLAENVNRMANALRGLGVGPGERVMLFCKDTPAFYYGFLGAARIGAVAVPVNYFLRRQDYEYMLADSGARVVLAFSDVFEDLAPALDSAQSKVRHRICCDGGADGWIDLDSLLAAAEPVAEPAPTTAESDCFWIYSSGSTGAPKASVHKHKDPIHTALCYGHGIVGLTADDVIFSPPKMFFAYGLGNSVTFPLWFGAEAILLADRPTAENTLALISEMKPTVYFGVPTLYAMQLDALVNGSTADLSSIRFSASGGEALPAPVFEGWRRRTGCDICDAIGSSEALHFYTSNRPGSIRPGSAGPIVPGYEGRIVGEEGRELPDGEVGQFAIRGDSVASHYWNKAERTAEAMRDGWFYTGDTCYRDEDGYYFFCGRDDDMLKVGGMWVSPFEIESALSGHPAVLESAVVGWPDANGLIKPKAFVVLKGGVVGSADLEGDLTGYVRSRLAPFKYPRRYAFVDALPKTASGKIQRFRLRQ